MATTKTATKPSPIAQAPCRQMINAFELTFPSRTPWRVSLYSAESVGDVEPSHEDRGSLKNAVWEFRKTNRHACTGPQHFVLDIDPATVAVPQIVHIPPDARIIGAGADSTIRAGQVAVFAEINTLTPAIQDRAFAVYRTGDDLPLSAVLVGSVELSGELHFVYEVPAE